MINTRNDNVEGLATKVAVVLTTAIYVVAFLSNWRGHLLFIMDRIMGALELLAGLIGLVFGFALIAVILRMLIIGLLDFIAWISQS
jgi:hypothetical protein